MLTTPDLIAQTGVSKTTIQKWIRKGFFRVTTRRKGREQIEYLIDEESWRTFYASYRAMPKHGNGRRLPSIKGAAPISLTPPAPGPKPFYGPRPGCAIDYTELQTKALKGHAPSLDNLRASGLTRWYRDGVWLIGGATTDERFTSSL